MNFKNELERRCFEIAERALGGGVKIDHNKRIQIESALFSEIASFKGPPAKEVDVLVAKLNKDPPIVLLVSCKLLTRRAEPAHVQEWCAVVQTLNKYSKGTLYVGLVVSPTGFTNGCEAWATSHNIGILPPLKGCRLAFNEDTVLRMFERILIALKARVRLQFDDLRTAPAFYEFVYRLTADFEGHQDSAADSRYFIAPQGWASSFGEMYAAIAGRKIEDLQAAEGATEICLSGGVTLRFGEVRVDFGPALEKAKDKLIVPLCRKNIELEPCTFDFLKSIAIGKSIVSAGDFGNYIEVGLDHHFNLGLYRTGFHVISTDSPIEKHRL